MKPPTEADALFPSVETLSWHQHVSDGHKEASGLGSPTMIADPFDEVATTVETV